MSWRKCLVRGLVFSVLLGLALAGWLYQRLTSPAVVKQQVIAKLESHFLGSHVRLESASLRLFGGISINDLRLIRSYDAEKTDVLYVPSGIIYHDKEQLLDGKLKIRKLELNKPRFRIIRNRDGSWNTASILGPVDLNETIPTIVIRRGTIYLEDRLAAPDAAPLEIKDVNLTIVNDPRSTLVIQLHGGTDLLGDLSIRTLWHRATSALAVRVEAPAVPVGPSLVARLGAYCSTVCDHARQLEGVAHMQVEVNYDPDSEHPWTHSTSCQLSQGKLQHPFLPLPLEQIEAYLRCTESGLHLEKLTARARGARVQAEATARQLHPDADFDGVLKVADLPLNADFFARLPEPMRRFQEVYAPVGLVNLDVEVHRRGGLWEKRSILSTNDGQACYCDFRYPLAHVRGRIEQHIDQARHIHEHHLDLVGVGSASRPIHIKGTIRGEGPKPAVHIDIWGEDIPLDEPLLVALPERFQKLARSFRPAGKGDCLFQLRRGDGAERWANRILVRIRDARICYDVFPYPLENVSGVLEILPDHWEFRDFRGVHKGGEFRTWGQSHPMPDQRDRISINIHGNEILLDDELERALAPKLRTAWRSLAIGGRMNLAAQVDQLPDRPEDIAVTVTANGCSLRPVFFPYLLTEVKGTVRYAHGRVDLEKLSGRHGATAFNLEAGRILLKPLGGFWARLENIRGSPIVLDADFQAALPPALKKVVAIAEPGTPVGLTTDLVVDMPAEPNLPPVIYWDGGIALGDARLNAGVQLENVTGQLWCQGRHDGRQLQGLKGNLLLDQVVLFRQPFRDVHSHVLIGPEAPDVLRLPDLQAHVFGGDVGGEARVEFGPTLHYNVNLTALQVRLEDLARHNLGSKEQWKGQASGRLYLSGHGSDVHGLEGYGQLDVPNGQMYNLPLLLDLIKVLGLRPPDRTAFEEAHASFSIKGPRVLVNRLDLNGNAISLSGQGEMNLDGTDLQLDFYAVWGRIKQVLPPLFRDIPPALGQQLLKIKMRGSVSDPKITKELMPPVVEPLERVFQRLTGKSTEAAKKPGDLQEASGER